MCIVSVFLELRINFFIDEGQEVPGDKVLIHLGDDTKRKVTYKNLEGIGI